MKSVLESPNASSLELLECAQVAKRFRERKLQEVAAQRLMNNLRNSPKHTELDVKRAAEHLVASWTADAEALRDLTEHLRRAKEWLGDVMADPRLKSRRTDHLLTLVSETLVLISAGDDTSRVELCSRLRRLENSALAIGVIEPVVARSGGSNAAAITTFAAALIDHNEALRAIDILKMLRPESAVSTHALLVLSRAQSSLGQHREAHQSASIAFETNPNEYSAHRLLASAAQIEDPPAFDKALRFIEEELDDGSPMISQNLLLLAAEELVGSDSEKAAEKAVRKLLEFVWSGTNAKRVTTLKRWLDQRTKLNLNLEHSVEKRT